MRVFRSLIVIVWASGVGLALAQTSPQVMPPPAHTPGQVITGLGGKQQGQGVVLHRRAHGGRFINADTATHILQIACFLQRGVLGMGARGGQQRGA